MTALPAGGRRRLLGVGVLGMAWLTCSLAPLSVLAQFSTPEGLSARSVSGQFMVRVMPGTEYSLAPANFETNREFIRLEPTLVPVSCERIKQILWRELGASTPYSGKIFVTVYPARGTEQPITISAEQFTDGWQYRVVLPNFVERARYVRTVTQTLLLEMANRGAVNHTAEVPPWLIEGVTQQLLASSEIAIILPPPSTPANNVRFTYTPMDARRTDPLERAHQVLCAAAPLTFQQLSWPAPEQLIGAAGEVYASCAQFFVHQLLDLKDGRACMRSMLAELPTHYNWQLAFLRAFQAHFPRPLEVEKWWALQVVHFTGRDLAQAWSAEESWQKLDEILHPTMQVRTGTNELPLRAEVSLQTIIREWDSARQPPALEAKLREFESLRLRLVQELVPLVDQYYQVVAAYLQNRRHSGFSFLRKQPTARQAARAAVGQLDALDARLAALRPPAKTSPPVQANAPVPSP